MKHEEMERQVREAILAYYQETKRFVLRIDAQWIDHQTMGGQRQDLLHRLEIITTDRTP